VSEDDGKRPEGAKNFTMLLLLLLVVLPVALGDACTKDQLISAVTPCVINKQSRDAYFWFPPTCVAIPPPRPVLGIPCDQTSCPVGKVLVFDAITTNRTACVECPPGTYSIGGGYIVANWNPIPYEFHTECYG
jgi:hypothetical protein